MPPVLEGPPNTSVEGQLSAALRAGTADVHAAAERAPVVAALLNDDGPLPIGQYVRLLTQYLAVYTALERAAATYRSDPALAAIAPPALDRAPAIAADLDVLAGDDWADRIGLTPATRAYVTRIEQASGWVGGFLAHHYVRYLGDLSGGQLIGRVLRRRLGQEHDRGLSFYVFDGLDNRVQFKHEYRRRLDALPFSAAEVDRIVAEARTAFAHNLDLFVSLGSDAGTVTA